MRDFNPLVNESDPRQDVYGSRRASEGRSRYRFAEMLLPPNGQGLKLLDVGGGMAEFARRCAALGYQVTLVDLNPNNVANARSVGLESHVIDFNIGLLGIDSDAFNVVVMLDVIEHIVNAERLLAEVWRVLMPGGLLVLSTPNFGFWGNRLNSLLGKTPSDEGYHYRFFTQRTLSGKLCSAKLSPEIWKFSAPAFGVNRVRRLVGSKDRKHVLIPATLGPLFGLTMFVQGIAEKRG